MMKHFHAWILTFVLVGLTVSNAVADSRNIFVNGARLDRKQIAQIDAAQCARVPNGHYWLNLYSGAWGYVGNIRTQGYLGSGCRRPGTTTRRKSLSERGLLYTPGDLNFR